MLRHVLVLGLSLALPLVAHATPPDTDSDGYPDSIDCAPEDPSIHPRANEIPYDGIDQDCSGGDLCDVDLDGYDAEACGGSDCDDDAESTSPAGVDIPGDGIDQDCSGADAELICDGDADGHDALVCGGLDCNDADAAIHPDAEEIDDDGIDQDCDGKDMCAPVPWIQGGMCSSGPAAPVWLALLIPALLLRRRR